MSSKIGSCPDCGPAPTIHVMEKIGAIMKTCVEPLVQSSSFQRYLEAVADPIADAMSRASTRAMILTGLATVVKKPDEHTPLRARCFWECAIRRGIRMCEIRPFGRAIDLYEYEHQGKKNLFHGLPRPSPRRSSSEGGPSHASNTGLDWMDNKGELRKHFLAAGIPMAKGGIGRTWGEVNALFEKLPHPVIVKPNIGSRGRHTTTRIETKEELRVAFDKAKKLSPWMIVEQEFIGTLHRVLLIDGRVVAVLRRDRAYIIGDGASTIQKIVNEENKNPRRTPSIIASKTHRSHPKQSGSHPNQDETYNGHPEQSEPHRSHPDPSADGEGSYKSINRSHPERSEGSYKSTDNEFCPLPTDAEATDELARQKLNWHSIPQKDEMIYLSRKPSRSVGGSTMDVTSETHQENIKLFERIAQIVNDPLIGVDFFMGGMSTPWNAQSCAGVIECNSLPFIDLHHYPLYGPVRDAAGALWDAVLK